MQLPIKARRLHGTGWIRARALLSLGMVLGLGAAGTLAQWSTTVSASTGVFSSGSIQMKLNGNRPTYAFTALNQLSLGANGSTAGLLPVQNTGALNFTYVANATTTDAGTASYGGFSSPSIASPSAAQFASNLTLSTFYGPSVAVTGAAGSETCTGGTLVQSQTLSTSAPVNIVSTARALNVGTTENLCIQVKLSSSPPVSARMAAVSVAMQFTATSS